MTGTRQRLGQPRLNPANIALSGQKNQKAPANVLALGLGRDHKGGDGLITTAPWPVAARLCSALISAKAE